MLIEEIDKDYITAYKAREEVAKASLGNAKSAIKSALIDKREPLTDDEVRAILAKKVKQHKDSISEFEKGGRADLVANETAQMKILEKYLPAQMDESQVREMVKAVIAETNATAKDFGKVMKEVLAKAAGQTDGSVVSKIVKEELK
jgi:uncharacterized protein YqeY